METEGFTGESQKQGATSNVPSSSSSACARCGEAGPGSEVATLASSGASSSPAAWHSGAMLKEQSCKDTTWNGAHGPGREELPLSPTSHILVATSSHQLLILGASTLWFLRHPTALTNTGISPSYLAIGTGPEKLSWYCDLVTWATGWWKKKLMEVCHFCSRSLTYISFAANAL